VAWGDGQLLCGTWGARRGELAFAVGKLICFRGEVEGGGLVQPEEEKAER